MSEHTPEQIEVSNCPTCGALAQFIKGGEIRHIDLTDRLTRENAEVKESLAVCEGMKAALIRENAALRELLKAFLAWQEKYPPERVYSHTRIITIAAELTGIMDKAREALAKVTP